MLDIKGIWGLDSYIGVILYVMTMNDISSSDLTDGVHYDAMGSHD
jgi:hypothetical protein